MMMSLRPAWATCVVPGQPGLHRKMFQKKGGGEERKQWVTTALNHDILLRRPLLILQLPYSLFSHRREVYLGSVGCRGFPHLLPQNYNQRRFSHCAELDLGPLFSSYFLTCPSPQSLYGPQKFLKTSQDLLQCRYQEVSKHKGRSHMTTGC